MCREFACQGPSHSDDQDEEQHGRKCVRQYAVAMKSTYEHEWHRTLPNDIYDNVGAPLYLNGYRVLKDVLLKAEAEGAILIGLKRDSSAIFPIQGE
jgi:hypothetical protein